MLSDSYDGEKAVTSDERDHHLSDALNSVPQSYHESLPCQQRTSISGGIISYLWSRLSYSNIF